jgi:hypothetical protein
MRVAPSGLENSLTLQPRALPWAIESRAFSALRSTALQPSVPQARDCEAPATLGSFAAHALRLTEPRSAPVSGSARALACSGCAQALPRPRGTPEDATNFHMPGFPNASLRPARARVVTREGACAPQKVAERRHDGSRGLQSTDHSANQLRRAATPETHITTGAINRRYATNPICRGGPWVKTHGYHQVLAAREFASTNRLKFGIWNLFGIWSLGFGVLSALSRKSRHCFHSSIPFIITNRF